MLPTSGYFRGVSCPEYEKGRCLRPYCHFHHYPRRDTNANQSQGLASGLENTDEIPVVNHTSDPKGAKAESVAEDQPTCSKSASSSPPKNESTSEVPEEATESSGSNQSELLQQLVADAVKKALAENPLLAAAGVDPTSLIKNIDTTALVAQASAEINQTKTKKKYLRPPDTPSYNPTPIEELNKRKRSVDGCEKEGVAPKVMKYVPSTVSSSSVISDVLEAEITKSSVDSEATDFSSDDAEEADKRRDDFDILEEVLAEHSQNNISSIKKKKKKSIGKISFNTITTEKNVKNSAVILDAQSSSDLDSKSLDTSKKKATEIQDMAEGSYFLPPSPVFTSSSDGFGMFDSTVYTTSNSDTSSSKTSQNLVIDGKEDKEPEKKDDTEKITDIPKKIGVNSSEEKTELKKEEVKSKNKGHSLLPQVVQTLSAPKMARRNVRNWTPQSRSTAIKPAGDPLDEILQLLDGEDSQKNSELKESGQKQSQQKVDSPNCGKTYKVDLDKEILSLTNLSSNKKDKTEPSINETLQEKIEKKDEGSAKESVVDQSSKGDKTEHISDKKVTAKTSKAKQEENKVENKGKDTDVESDNESEEHDKDSKSGKHSDGDITSKDEESCDSDHKRGRHRKKRKRDRSSSSDSEHSYHRKKRKKSHKRHRKYSRSKRKRKHRSSRDDSDEDEDSDRDEEGSEDEKSEDSRENIDDDETGRVKKHKKHKKRGRHHKKYKYKRRRSKSKRKRNRSRSSSRSSSQSSSSRNRSRSRTKSDSESSDRSRSVSRSPSPGRRKNKDRHKTSNSRESEEKLKRKNSATEGQVTKDKTQVLSVPMPVDPSKIKTEKDLIPDLSIVKIEKDVDTMPNISNKKEETPKQIEKRSSSDISVKTEKDSHTQLNNETSSKNSESHSRRDHSKKRTDRKSSTDSMSDKGSTHRRQSTDSKKSESETTSGNSKQELKRRTSVDTVKKDNITQDSQGKVMSMFDLVIASTQQTQQQKTLKEISMFDSNGNVSEAESVDDDHTEPLINEDTGSQKDDSHSKIKSGHLSKSHSNSSTRKEDKSESKRKHSSSSNKEKSSSHKSSSSHQSSSSSKHRSNSSSSKHSSSAVSSSTSSTKETHSSKAKEKSGVSSSTHGSGSNKHHTSEHSSSSRSQKSSSSSSSSRKKEHSSSSSSSRKKEHSSSSKSDGKIKESSRNKRYSTENEDSVDILDKEMVLGIEGGDSPLPDLSALDEIPQDDWEEMMNSSDKNNLQHLENLREDFSLDDLDKDDPEVMEECMRMFNEYRPEDSQPQTSSKKPKVSAKEVTDTYTGKKRVARSSTGNLIAKKPEHRSHKLTPAQVMMERFKKMKEEHVELMKQLEKQKQQLEEQSRASSSSSAVSSTTSSKLSTFPASSTSLKSPPMSTPGGPKRRISHVPNVSSLLHAREKIKNLPPAKSRNLLSPSVAKASGALPHTTAHTVAKGGKRIAHIPKAETLTRPTIPAEFGSKVPQNIRQRYLNSFIDECLKFAGKKTAFRISMAEERVCYNRAASRMVYLNLAVNTLKRLRTQQAIGEAAQELLDNDPQFAEYSESEEPSTSMKSSSVSTPSSSKNTSSHPVNPNHAKRSHFSVLACGGQKGSWSIEKPKKNTVDVNDCLKGANFYKLMKKYVLTEDQLQQNGYPMPDPEEKGRAIIHVKDTRKKLSPSPLERYCDRCSLLYRVDKWGFPTTVGPCVYHWGRAYKRRGFSGLETRYSCCGGDLESDGCVQATTHVSQNYNPNDLRGYVRTLPKESGSDGDFGVYALDCEMCYTTAGNELTRVTVIDTDGNSVYEQLVKPENPIIDYNTRFSGITESDMEDVKTTILDVQAAMLTRFSDKTILVGHSLESDFQALKLIHDTVVDTSVVFPHKMGPPYKRALRNLASEILKKIIQNDVSGHDSAEDAITCMHLMQWRVKEDLKRIKK